MGFLMPCCMFLRQCIKRHFRNIITILFPLISLQVHAVGNDPVRAAEAHHIQIYYPEQLTNPQKKSRKSMAQFGYNLSYFTIPIFPITEFVNPNNLGVHSYSQGA